MIGAHTLAVIEAGARVGARGGEKFDRATIELFDKYMEASLAEAAKAISETRADLLSVRNALKGPAR